MIADFLKQNYHIHANKIEQMTTGAGGTTYKITTQNGIYVLKLSKEDSINHPHLEPFVCETLRQNDIHTLHFLKNTENSYSTQFDDFIANVYEYIPGKPVLHNSMDDALVNECASTLARINFTLHDWNLPVGLSQGFFDYMTPDRVRQSYYTSLQSAQMQHLPEIEKQIRHKISLLDFIETWRFDCSQLTYCNSHGDFTNNQIIVNDHIHIIDFTACCQQPIIWELTRFFFHADRSAVDGHLNLARYFEYLQSYTAHIKLNDYDNKNLFKLYYYQLLVCDYYSQYFEEVDPIKKSDYLTQANFASRILYSNSEMIRHLN